MVVIYLGSLVLLLLASFWSVGGLLGTEIVHSWNLDNYRTLVEEPVYRDVAFRTISMAALVTIADAVLAFPIAYYMARVASPRTRNLLVVAVLTPLWASYLVKAYSWRTILGEDGVLNWLLAPFGLSGPGYTSTGLWLAFTYLWLPFMILPIYAGLERIPSSLARGVGGSRREVAPDLLEGDAAPYAPGDRRGSIFTFSLTLGDYILPGLIANEQFIGTVIYSDRGLQLPLAAAFAMVPVAVMTVYLWGAKRLGAFESL